MVEFALVLPLLLMVIFLVMSVAIIEGVRIEEQKAAYDAARHLAKVAVSGNGGAQNDEAVRVIQLDYDHSTLLHVFTAGVSTVDIGPGPLESGDAPSLAGYAVTVRTSYHLANVPGWDYLNRLYGSGGNGAMHEVGVAVIVK
jgi:Flp pilus assembly protein TadG